MIMFWYVLSWCATTSVHRSMVSIAIFFSFFLLSILSMFRWPPHFNQFFILSKVATICIFVITYNTSTYRWSGKWWPIGRGTNRCPPGRHIVWDLRWSNCASWWRIRWKTVRTDEFHGRTRTRTATVTPTSNCSFWSPYFCCCILSILCFIIGIFVYSQTLWILIFCLFFYFTAQ